VKELAKMYGKDDELQLPMNTQFGFLNQLSADAFRRKLREAETDRNGNIPLFVFDNHDNRRSWNRYGDGKHDEAIAKLIATLLLTPRCTALLYYGQELGMSNSDPKSKDQVKDPIGRIGWPKEIGRDGERTPMQWNAEANAGFSKAKTTWLPVAPDYAARNVSAESRDPKSMLSYYKMLIWLRKENSALHDPDRRYRQKCPVVCAQKERPECFGSPQLQRRSANRAIRSQAAGRCGNQAQHVNQFV
jgi:alpha-glucosidase